MAPAIFTAVNATADETTSAERPDRRGGDVHERADVDARAPRRARRADPGGSSGRRRRAPPGRGRGAARAPRRRRRRGRPVSGITAFSSQTRRRPSSVRNGSTRSIVRECGATRSARPPVATRGRLGAELLADPADDPVHLAREAVHEPRLEPADRRLPDHRRRRGVVDLHEPRGAREQRLHRDLDPRREHAADVLALRRDDVEVRRGAEVDDDDRRAVALLRRDRVHDPVRPDLARIVVADRDPGLDARADDEQRRLRPLRRERLPLPDEHGHGAGEADPVDGVEVEQPGEDDAELVGGRRALRREAPVVRELAAGVEAERPSGCCRRRPRGARRLVNQSGLSYALPAHRGKDQGAGAGIQGAARRAATAALRLPVRAKSLRPLRGDTRENRLSPG